MKNYSKNLIFPSKPKFSVVPVDQILQMAEKSCWGLASKEGDQPNY
jgi:hypothetical protein